MFLDQPYPSFYIGDLNMSQKISLVVLFVFLLFSDVSANMGLPMIMIVWPVYWIGLLPITLIEWWVMKKELPGLSSKKLMKNVFFANLISTIFGIPAVWFAMAVIQMLIPGGGGTFPGLRGVWPYILGVTVQAPWLIPYESQFYWMIPVAFIVLLIPFFFASYRIEAWFIVSGLHLDEKGKQTIRQAVKKANVFSYAFLLIAALITLAVQVVMK